MGVLVVIKSQQDRDQWIEALNDAGVQWTDFPGLPRIFRVEGVTTDTFPLKQHPGVESIEPDDLPVKGSEQTLSISATLSGASWAIARVIRRRAPWPTSRLQFPRNTYYRCERDGTGVDFYSFDSGIRTSHVEFGGRASSVYEYFSSGGAGDDNGHGSATSSCACGATVGVARGASLFSFKCLDSSNAGTNTSLISAISEALTHYAGRSGLNRPAVANLSLGGFGSAINTAIADMINAGIVVVASAGNDRIDLGTIDYFPAESDADVIVVGGVGAADIPYFRDAGGSNWGTRVDLSAPSQNIRAAISSGDSAYDQWAGTSFGCGFASGVVACMLEGHPRLTGRTQVQAVKAKLMANATTGKLANPGTFGITLPDRILYLNPNQAAPEPISGL